MTSDLSTRFRLLFASETSHGVTARLPKFSVRFMSLSVQTRGVLSASRSLPNSLCQEKDI